MQSVLKYINYNQQRNGHILYMSSPCILFIPSLFIVLILLPLFSVHPPLYSVRPSFCIVSLPLL